MIDNKQIDVLRVEVLDNNVQKYSSTTVSGGGGYVSTANGVTVGQAEPVTSTVHHHVSQDIWVRDLSSGRELQLKFDDLQVPVRAGHRLWLAYDHRSERWERIVNETTGESTYGDGFTNPNYVSSLLNQAKGAYFYVILLIIPYLNLLGGPLALGMFLAASNNFSNKKVPGIGRMIVKTLAAGFGLFCAGYWAVFAIGAASRETGIIHKAVSIVALLTVGAVFVKSHKAPYMVLADMVTDRSKRIDAVLQQARAKHLKESAA